MKIKNWSKFQHFRDRKPPWIKLYREILDDIDWHELDPLASKVLVMCWLIASELDGNLPNLKTLAFRLRMSERQAKEAISRLSHWLEQDDINVISERYQLDSPETETERETKKEVETDKRQNLCESDFDQFWNAYPKKTGKELARKAWVKSEPSISQVLNALAWQTQSQQWRKDGGQFIPMPATYLNQSRWEDEPVDVKPFNKQMALEQTNSTVANDWANDSNVIEG